jgi:hypothetical protein
MASTTSKSSIALFMAAAGMFTAHAGFVNEPVHAQSALASSQLLAQATQECVPIGEGENCAKPRKRKKQTLTEQENNSGSTPNNPAADTSRPTPNPGAQSGTAREELNQIERGDL